jgi:hypothetical protein
MKKSFIVLIFLAGLAIGLGLGWILPKNLKTVGLTSLTNRFNGSQSEETIKTDNLIGQVLEVKDKSLIFKTRVRSNGDLLIASKEAKVNDQTAIYALTPKIQEEYYNAEYTKKIDQLKESFRVATEKKNVASAKKIMEQIRALMAEAATAKSVEVQALEQKLAGLTDGSTEKQDLIIKLAELNSNFKYSRIKLSDIKVDASVQVWSDEDLTNSDKFVATKIEVKQ